MNRKLCTLSLSILISAAPAYPGHAEGKEPEVPAAFAFRRSIDVAGFVQRTSEHGLGAQSLRVRARYLDPDVNAFVGLLTGASHFNRDLYLGSPTAPDTSNLLWNWGGDFGIVRGAHLWELDLMGTVLSARIGPAVALVGEHAMGSRCLLYHRTEGNFFVGDTVVDADQGLTWMPWKTCGFSAGYRIFASRHMSRNGPYVGVRVYFESPRIPFIFPSLG